MERDQADWPVGARCRAVVGQVGVAQGQRDEVMPSQITTAAIVVAVVAVLAFCAVVVLGLWVGKQLDGGIGDIFDPWQ